MMQKDIFDRRMGIILYENTAIMNIIIAKMLKMSKILVSLQSGKTICLQHQKRNQENNLSICDQKILQSSPSLQKQKDLYYYIHYQSPVVVLSLLCSSSKHKNKVMLHQNKPKNT